MSWRRTAARIAGLSAPVIRAALRRIPPGTARVTAWRFARPLASRASHDYAVSVPPGFVLAGNTRDMIQGYVYFFGVWEPQVTAWIGSALRPGDTFVDVGANVGYYSLLASRIVGPHGRVVAFEASPAIFAHLRRNLEANRATNVRALNVAISDAPGTVAVFAGPERNVGQTTIIPVSGSRVEASVVAQPLPAALDEHELRSARVMKIDVEGAEWQVVSGLLPSLAKLNPRAEILVELSPDYLRRDGRSADDVVSRFAAAGFRPYAIENDYREHSYLVPFRYRAPRRVREPVDRQADIVFSRTDAETL